MQCIAKFVETFFFFNKKWESPKTCKKELNFKDINISDDFYKILNLN